jgi:hypothetical protein
MRNSVSDQDPGPRCGSESRWQNFLTKLSILLNISPKEKAIRTTNTARNVFYFLKAKDTPVMLSWSLHPDPHRDQRWIQICMKWMRIVKNPGSNRVSRCLLPVHLLKFPSSMHVIPIPVDFPTSDLLGYLINFFIKVYTFLNRDKMHPCINLKRGCQRKDCRV